MTVVVLFVGTPEGMTPHQEWTVSRTVWRNRRRIDLAIHPDEYGATVQFDWACSQSGLLRQSRPRLSSRKGARAKLACEFAVEPVLDHSDWLRQSSAKSDLLLAAGDWDCDEGTKAAVDFWRENDRPVMEVLPDGSWTASCRTNSVRKPWRFDFVCPFGSILHDLRFMTDYASVRAEWLEKKTFAFSGGFRQNTSLSVILGLLASDRDGISGSG